ncbi:S8 family peptidase [Desmonostoc muscorum LEGE 12446]|nr:S8 family peptidase [Desmonostoc muscorum]MCF2148199.1 S8 family peptidase [Desmonostoc muscorum LEGE 12446]
MRYLGVFILGICLVIYLQILGNAQQLVSSPQEKFPEINQEYFQEILADFDERKLPANIDIESWVQQLFSVFPTQEKPQISKFLRKDNVYLIKGGLNLLNQLQNSINFKQYTECIEPNYIYQKASVSPNDLYYPLQWNLQETSPGINVEKAWAITRGEGVKVAVLDSGINPQADFNLTKILPGYDFVDNQQIFNKEDFQDQDGHGTHISGTIAQSTNNRLGVAGIAYESALMPLRVLDNDGNAHPLDIAAAIRVAVDNGADVINLSLAGKQNSCLIKKAVDYAHNKGVVIVAAAGNLSINTSSYRPYPASYEHVIGVAAYDRNGSRASYSNDGGDWVDIYAPGGSTSNNKCTDTINDLYSGIVQIVLNLPVGFTPIACQGTSQAAAHVSGVAALVKAVLKESPFYNFFHNSADEVINIIKESARPVNGIQVLDAGKANEVLLLDAGKAVELAWKKVHPPFPVVSLPPDIVQTITERLTKNRDWLIPVGIGSGLTIWGIFGSYKLICGVMMTLVGGLWSLNQAIHTSNLLLQVVLILPLAIVPPVLIIFITGNSRLKWLSFGTGIGAVVVLAGAATQPNLGIGLQLFSGICAFLLGLLVLLAMKDEE